MTHNYESYEMTRIKSFYLGRVHESLYAPQFSGEISPKGLKVGLNSRQLFRKLRIGLPVRMMVKSCF